MNQETYWIKMLAIDYSTIEDFLGDLECVLVPLLLPQVVLLLLLLAYGVLSLLLSSTKEDPATTS